MPYDPSASAASESERRDYRLMAHIRFVVRYHFSSPPQQVWNELVNWSGHGAWIPATRVVVDPGDPTAVGATFTAWTGIGKLALEDRMRVSALEWSRETGCGMCRVDKLGPILQGAADFTVSPDRSEGTDLRWVEDVTVRRVPQFIAPLLAQAGALGFKQGMRRLARLLMSSNSAG